MAVQVHVVGGGVVVGEVYDIPFRVEGIGVVFLLSEAENCVVVVPLEGVAVRGE